jgi:hypothetical protein
VRLYFTSSFSGRWQNLPHKLTSIFFCK